MENVEKWVWPLQGLKNALGKVVEKRMVFLRFSMPQFTGGLLKAPVRHYGKPILLKNSIHRLPFPAHWQAKPFDRDGQIPLGIQQNGAFSIFPQDVENCGVENGRLMAQGLRKSFHRVSFGFPQGEGGVTEGDRG